MYPREGEPTLAQSEELEIKRRGRRKGSLLIGGFAVLIALLLLSTVIGYPRAEVDAGLSIQSFQDTNKTGNSFQISFVDNDQFFCRPTSAVGTVIGSMTFIATEPITGRAVASTGVPGGAFYLYNFTNATQGGTSFPVPGHFPGQNPSDPCFDPTGAAFFFVWDAQQQASVTVYDALAYNTTTTVWAPIL